ncbi:response regulator transcription factor [Maribacter hydrothermalis]|uniref:DNA-binding response regulator n=1 Tax=Maribacter hydrothermalis TaxID=1836467 RepID=A0A1B7Z060_9FLAO|nr:response regulator transcription factor [Maribacter hydrothermalis]APQ19210.1 DNA-binding response regulator [Maribacter hydrothermalis]OBR36099.1 DNA-binding response regulator [Maribacter hydrothermalis]
MNNSRIRIIVLEKDKSLHSVYKNHFEDLEGYELVGSYTTAYEALKDFKYSKPNIVLSEIELKDMNGIDSIRLFRKKDWGVKVIMFSEINDFDVIKNSFKKGANGYLTKPLTLDKLDYALRSMEKDGAAMSNDIVKKIITNFHKKTFDFFSERENQIVDFLCQGATYKMIAQKLFVTPSAVNFHIQNIYLKLDVNSKSEALSKLEQLQNQLEEY